jgi:hypothetical protein
MDECGWETEMEEDTGQQDEQLELFLRGLPLLSFLRSLGYGGATICHFFSIC